MFSPITDGVFDLLRQPASGVLAPFVQEYWLTSWDLRDRPPCTARLLPSPCVNVTFKRGRSRITGVTPAMFTEVLEGRHRVFGARFRPGGFRPFMVGPVTTITGCFLPVTVLFGDAAGALADCTLAAEDLTEMIDAFEAQLRTRGLPRPDATAQFVAQVVESIDMDADLLRVEQLATLHGCDVRRLQRLFADYVGVSPKWTIRRYRMQEAAARAAASESVGWSRLASELGYSAQPHFVRDFVACVGVSPNSYRASTNRPTMCENA